MNFPGANIVERLLISTGSVGRSQFEIMSSSINRVSL